MQRSAGRYARKPRRPWEGRGFGAHGRLRGDMPYRRRPPPARSLVSSSGRTAPCGGRVVPGFGLHGERPCLACWKGSSGACTRAMAQTSPGRSLEPERGRCIRVSRARYTFLNGSDRPRAGPVGVLCSPESRARRAALTPDQVPSRARAVVRRGWPGLARSPPLGGSTATSCSWSVEGGRV